MKRICVLLVFCNAVAVAQSIGPLTVEKIMRDPKWMGVSPSAPMWSLDSKTLYFSWNPESNVGDSLYAVTTNNHTPVKVHGLIRRKLPPMSGTYNRARTKKLYEKNGDIFLADIRTGAITEITNTVDREGAPFFSVDEKKIFFTSGSNLFSWEIATGSYVQLTDFKKTPKKDAKLSEQERWLKADQLATFDVLRQRSAVKKQTEKNSKSDKPLRPKEIYVEEKVVDNFQVSPDQRYITYRLSKAAGGRGTIVPAYVTESGFTEDLSARAKVGAPPAPGELFVYDIHRDTSIMVTTDDIPGIKDTLGYQADYKKKTTAKSDKKPDNRSVSFYGPLWSANGEYNIVVVRSIDNKDRWILSLDLETRKLTLLDRQHDEAWIGGPGIGGFFGSLNIGWLNDNRTIWYQSEETGFSHVYTLDVVTKKKTQITSGAFEVQYTQLSADKNFFYLVTNEQNAGERHFYKMPVRGGKAEKLTIMDGANDVLLSPDEKWLSIRHSYTNKPWELYIQENKPGAKPQQITDSRSPEFKSYAWRDPDIVKIKSRDGVSLYSRLYKPAKQNGAAVIFVHGAGYLQNAHRWWSSYFREYMFHNLLADLGYTVLDIDFRASAGYGRKWRTDIYRHMGGKDLDDQVDGAQWLVTNQNIDPKRIGIYGGSYGGFITLMAMFTTPDVFRAGAALRPVTDWAHYNHGYTASILNEPTTDSLAYVRSSPIYYAQGLKGSLLICHGMLDVNVHFQDAVRLSQRLIELGKDDWELAVYPVEDHGFVEPSSWTDEYKRILKLFETRLK